MKTTFPKGTPVVYHLFDGRMGHKEEYGVFIDNLTNRRCIVRFKDRIEAVDKDWLMKRDGMEYIMKRILEDRYFKGLFSDDELCKPGVICKVERVGEYDYKILSSRIDK